MHILSMHPKRLCHGHQRFAQWSLTSDIINQLAESVQPVTTSVLKACVWQTSPWSSTGAWCLRVSIIITLMHANQQTGQPIISR